MMRLRHIEVFHAVMQAGSISGAATLLSISQPAASKLLSSAERSLGLSLFQRLPGGLKPTHEATLLFSQTNKVHKGLEDVRRLALNLQAHSGGLLRIGSIPSLGFSIVPRAVAAFSAIYPDASLSIQTHNSEALCDLLLSQDLDVAIAFDPQLRPGVQAKELGRARAAYVPPHGDNGSPYDLHAPAVSLASLIGQKWIGPEAEDPLGAKIFETLTSLGHENAVPAIEVKTYYVARELAQCGVAGAIVDEFTAQVGHHGSVHFIDPPIDVGVAVLTAINTTSSRARDVLISCLQAEFARKDRRDRSR